MTAYVILFRNTISKQIGYVNKSDEDDNVKVFETYTDAAEAAQQVPICQACPYEIVELGP